jgi:hypothetical protein
MINCLTLIYIQNLAVLGVPSKNNISLSRGQLEAVPSAHENQ